MRGLIRSYVAAASLAFLALACSGDGGRSVTPTASAGPKETVTVMPFHLSTQGAVKTSVRQSVPVRRVVLLGDKLDDIRYFGLEPSAWLDAGALEIKASVNIINFNGDGSYRVPPTVELTKPSESTGSTLSNARVEFRRSGHPETLDIYSIIEKECAVEVRSGGEAGTLRCPGLSNGRGSVALTVVWGRASS